jgi:hypothetical protein
VKADRSLLLRAQAAYELLRRDPDVDRVELLAAVVWPPAVLEVIEQPGCRSCGVAFEPVWPAQRYCGSAECAREANNARSRAYTRRQAAA